MKGTEFARISGSYSTAYIGTWELLGRSIEKNESYIRLYGFFYYGGGTSVGSSGSSYKGFYLNGTYIASGSYRYYPGYTELNHLDITVKHNDDGTFPGINIKISASSYHMSGETSGNIPYGAIATIPRATDCPNLDGYIESSAPISLNPAVDTFKHRLYYSYNGKTGYYPSSTGFFTNTGSLNLDTSFYEKTPKSSGTGSLTLYTYSNDGTYIGEDTGTLTVRCDKDKCQPDITATIIDINSVTSKLTSGANTSSKLVQGYSNAQITYTITPKNGASISSKKINNVTLGDSPHIINNVETGNFEIVAIDSRGFETKKTIDVDVIDYVPLRLNFNAFRPSPTESEIKVNFTGTYFNNTFGSVANTLQLSWKYKIKGTSEWITGGNFTKDTDYKIVGNTFYSGTGSSASDITLSTTLFPYNKAFDIGIFYKDKLIDSGTSKPVPKGEPVVNWSDGLFNVNGVLTVNKENILQKNIMTIYSDNRFNIDVISQIPNKLNGLTSYLSVGNKLIYSDSSVKIGKGVSKVLVSGAIAFWHSTNFSQSILMVTKNGQSVLQRYNQSPSDVYETESIVLSPVILEVSEGDEIALNFYSGAEQTIEILTERKDTNLTVEVVE